jgi:nucleotide-binding universal stress UspA family protein
MKHIIVPTDFSDNALKAAKFALSLAKDLEAQFSLVHAYQCFRSGFQSDRSNLEDEVRAKEEAEREMDIFIQKLQQNGYKVPVKSECIEGTLLALINQIKNDTANTVIVMGTTGATGIKYHLIGSNTLFIAKKTSLPLLTVPMGIENCEIKKVAVFTDYKEEDKKNLSNLRSFFGNSKVSYRLFHIHEKKESPLPADYEKLEKWAEELKIICGIGDLSYELVVGKENATLVNEIAKREDIDLLTLTMVGQNFWDRLFEKSLSKAIILQGTTPVFIQH